MPKAWIRERKKDCYYRRAKEEKLRSRAAYKLLQSVEKYRFIKLGDVVVDLGAAPGGWIQVSQRIVGEKGFVLGIDIKQIEPFDLPNVATVVLNIIDPQTIDQIRQMLPCPADVLISDVSPNVCGIWELDHIRQIDLVRESMRIAESVLKPKGNFFVKVFQGSTLNNLVKEIKNHFTFVKLIKPKASRTKSAELYLLAMNYVSLSSGLI